MNRYWTRIALGALLVFGLGLTGMAAVNKGKAEVTNLLSTAARRLPLQLAHLGFRFRGQQIGRVTGIDVQRSESEELGSFTIRVALGDEAALDELRKCRLTADDIERWNSRTGFRCAEDAELEGDLVKMGDVVFQPEGMSRPLYLPGHTANRWRNSGVRSLDASLSADGHGGVAARGRYDLMNGQHGLERGTFSLQADSGGANLSVRDDQGRALVNFRADQNGVNLSLKDRHGRNLLKLLSDSLGAAIKMHRQ
jgi:hypothetical protein